jgi:CubicO group peptidase (beta-lactamase class C family)
MKSAAKDMGGGGMYSSAGDYIKLLSALLRNDDTLLSKSSVSELLKPQVKDNAHLDHERNAHIFSNIWPNGAKVTCNHSLGGLVSMEDLSTGRKTGSVMWLGATAIVWVSQKYPRSVPKEPIPIHHGSGLTRKARCAASSAHRLCLELRMWST